MFHYVYAIVRNSVLNQLDFENPWIYIGVRSSKTPPHLDKYMGSGRLINKVERHQKTKIVIETFDTRHEANLFEKEIVNLNFINYSGSYNLITGGGRSLNVSEELIRLSISEISKKYWQTVEYRQLNTLEYLRTEEVKKKISIALSQFYTNGGSPWNKGIKYSDEQCLNLKIKLQTYWESNKEKYEDWKSSISNGIKFKWQDKEYKEKQNNLDYLHTDETLKQISASNKISCNTPEFKLAASNRAKALWQDKEYKEKQNNLDYLHTDEIKNKRKKSIKEFYATDEGKKIASNKMKALWQSEEFRKNNDLSYLRTEEVKKKISEGAKRQFAKPLICPHCKFEGRGPWMYQKHFKNCKFLENKENEGSG